MGGWGCERAEAPSPSPLAPAPVPILPIRSVLSSGSSTGPGGSAFSGRGGLLLLGGGRGCFWRRTNSTAGRGRAERGPGRGQGRDGPRAHALTVLVVLALYLVVVVQRGLLRLRLRLWGNARVPHGRHAAAHPGTGLRRGSPGPGGWRPLTRLASGVALSSRTLPGTGEAPTCHTNTQADGWVASLATGPTPDLGLLTPPKPPLTPRRSGR